MPKPVRMRRPARPRLHTLLLLLFLVALGLGSRRRGLPAFVLLYVGDVLWGTLFYFLFVCAWPRISRTRAFVAALVTTETIELTQAYHAPWLDGVRDSRLGGLLLGHDFSWHDVICVALGALLGILVDRAMHRPSSG